MSRLRKTGSRCVLCSNVLAKSGYKVRTDEISPPAYQSIGLGKLCIDLVSAEFIASAIY